jgi:catechol 2,3-dioxygenase
VERSTKFYTEVLDLEITQRRETPVLLSAREHSHALGIRGIGSDASGPDSRQVGTHHFAWEMASFEDLQAMVRHLKEKGVDIVRVRENTYSVDVYIHDPDGNGIEVDYEEPGGYRRAWEGQYARKLLI